MELELQALSTLLRSKSQYNSMRGKKITINLSLFLVEKSFNFIWFFCLLFCDFGFARELRINVPAGQKRKGTVD